MLFANNCNTTLNGGITAIATSMVVTSAIGFPTPTGSQYFYCTLADAATQTTIEIVKVTAVSGTTFTIVRGQDGTTGTIFSSGAVVSLRLVAASLNDFPKLDEANTFTYAPTFSTALAVGSGGTGLTSLTAGYIPYGNGTSAFSSTANLTYSGTFLNISGPAITWNSAFNGVQTSSCSLSTLTNDLNLLGNAYYDSVGWKYIASKPASYFTVNNTNNGDQIWYTAPSGTAGAAVTWTEQMRLTNAGNLSVANKVTAPNLQGPAFRATATSSQTFTVNVLTKVAFNSSIFDTNSNYDPTTNYRFTPKIAGYYQVTGTVSAQTTSGLTAIQANIYKNGSNYEIGNSPPASTYAYPYAQVTSLVYMNGSTDYVECYGVATGASGTVTCQGTYFQAVMVRGA